MSALCARLQRHPAWPGISALLVLMFLFVSIYLAFQWKDPSTATSYNTLTFTTMEVAQSRLDKRPDPSETTTLSWQQVETPHSWGAIWPYYNGVVWYRAKFNRTQQQQVIYVSYVYNAATVFLNRKQIAQTDAAWPPVTNDWQKPEYWQISESALKTGENELLIAVYGMGQTRPGLGLVHIGSRAEIDPIYQRDMLLQQFLPFLTLCAAFLVGLANLSLWLLYRKDTMLLWFGLYSLTWLGLLLKFFPVVNQFMGQHIGIYASETLCEIALAIRIPTLFKTTLRYCGYSHPKLENASWVYTLACLIWILYAPLEPIYLRRVFTSGLGPILTMAIAGLVFWYALGVKSSLSIRIMAFGLLTIPLVLAHDGAAFLDFQPNRVLIQGYWVFFLILMTSSITIARFINRTRQEEVNNSILNSKVSAIQSELEQSTVQERALALTTARQQERAKLWQDVHNGLSRSITSSIELLQHGQVHPEKTLSLLQSMREDLSYAISVGSQVEELTLESSLANVRRQMVERLANAGIRSYWSMPVNCNVPYNVALNLPVVVRELLTNVIKHSEATEVHCEFGALGNLLRVQIQDNGRGIMHSLDLGNVAGLGILRMRNRVEKMNGTWCWNSGGAGQAGVKVEFTMPLNIDNKEESPQTVFTSKAIQ